MNHTAKVSLTLIATALSAVIACAKPISEQIAGWSGNNILLHESIIANKWEIELLERIGNYPLQARPRLVIDPYLMMTARLKAEDMSNRGYYAHEDPDGKDIWDYGLNLIDGENLTGAQPMVSEATREWLLLHSADKGYPEIGQEMAARFPISAMEDALYMFVTSSGGHREAVLGTNAHYSQTLRIGVGVSPALLNGVELHIVVVHFGRGSNTTRLAYSPDGTPIGGMDPKRMGYSAGLLAQHDGSKWHNWFGSFVDVGGGFLLHDKLGMIWVDEPALDKAHTLNTRPYTGRLDDLNINSLPYLPETRGIAKQGVNFYHADFGWCWTHPQMWPKVIRHDNGQWMTVGDTVRNLSTQEVRDYRAGAGGTYAQLIFGNWQVYEGEPVVLAWNTQGLSNVTVEANHRQSKAKLHAWGWTAQGVGEHLAKLYSEQGVVEKPLWVLPQPQEATVWIDADPRR